MNTQKDSVNNELRHAVKVIKNLKKKGKTYKESEESEEEFTKKLYNFMNEKKYDFNGFDKDGVHKDTGKDYDPNVLIDMVFTLISMINIIVKVLI